MSEFWTYAQIFGLQAHNETLSTFIFNVECAIYDYNKPISPIEIKLLRLILSEMCEE